ncbi:MAG: HEAT repeat domain-containing protein [Thermoanaerobaculia bacterium]
MARLSKELRAALDSDCAHSLEGVATRLRPGDLDALVEQVETATKPQRRQNAISLLGRSRHAEAVPAIARVLPGIEEEGRCRAISALGNIGGVEAVEAIVRCLRDDSPQVRKFVAVALRGKDHPGAAAARATLARDDVAWVRKALRPRRKRKGRG